MIRVLRMMLALYVVVVLQTLLAPAIEILGARPDFPLLLVLLGELDEGPHHLGGYLPEGALHRLIHSLLLGLR